MKSIKLLMGCILVVSATFFFSCDDDDNPASSGGTSSCDVKFEFEGVSDHTCTEGAALTQDECTQMGVAVSIFNGTSTFGTGCAAGAALKCEENGTTTHHYTIEEGDTCESLAADEEM